MPGCYKHRKAQCTAPCEWKVGVGCREGPAPSPAEAAKSRSSSKSPSKKGAPAPVWYHAVYTAYEIKKYISGLGKTTSTEAIDEFNRMCSYLLSAIFYKSTISDYDLASIKRALPGTKSLYSYPDIVTGAKLSKRIFFKSSRDTYIQMDKESFNHLASFLEGLMAACWAPAAKDAKEKKVELRHLLLAISRDPMLHKLFKGSKDLPKDVHRPVEGVKPVYDSAFVSKVMNDLHPGMKVAKDCVPWINGMVRPLLDRHKTVLSVFPKGTYAYKIAEEEMKTDDRMLEFLLGMFLQSAGSRAMDARSKTVRTEHLEDELVLDSDLNEMFSL